MKRSEIFETIIIFAGIVSLWFRYILHWPGIVWQFFPLIMLVLLVWVFARRVRRFKDALAAARRETDRTGPGS
ncbi:MAG: hypothetical protein HY318_07425 [Armatimonadetes bacterium]|nr:hypothetical protein [Armatimonadota bacterium]